MRRLEWEETPIGVALRRCSLTKNEFGIVSRCTFKFIEIPAQAVNIEKYFRFDLSDDQVSKIVIIDKNLIYLGLGV